MISIFHPTWCCCISNETFKSYNIFFCYFQIFQNGLVVSSFKDFLAIVLELILVHCSCSLKYQSIIYCYIDLSSIKTHIIFTSRTMDTKSKRITAGQKNASENGYVFYKFYFKLFCELRSNENFKYIVFLPPANEVCEGFIFTGVCLSTG